MPSVICVLKKVESLAKILSTALFAMSRCPCPSLSKQDNVIKVAALLQNQIPSACIPLRIADNFSYKSPRHYDQMINILLISL